MAVTTNKKLRAKTECLCWKMFFEIIEGTYKEKKRRVSCFGSGYVQAVFISERETASGKTARLIKKLKVFFQKNTCYIFPYRRFVVILFEDTQEPDIKRLLEKLSGFLEKTNNRYAITLGNRLRENNAKPGLSVRKSCREAEELQKKIFFYKDKKYLSLSDLQDDKNAESKQYTSQQNCDEQALISYIQIIDHEKIQSFFLRLETVFFNSGKSPQKIRQDCMILMMEVYSSLVKKFPFLKEMLENKEETLEAIIKLPYLKDIINTMMETCLHISKCLPLLSAELCFQRVISYVKNNYNEALKLESLGKLFNYNCAYLGKRFKDYTGKNFHTYLDMLRTDAAKELLQNTNMKVYEISGIVGYTETDYFYTKFKKYVGESPLVFRKRTANNVK
jgi:two-component system response regulator YesN